MDGKILNRVLRPLKQRIFLMIARGVFRALIEDKGQPQLSVMLLDGEEAQNVELIQPFGMATSPPPDSDCLVVCPGGDRGMGICIAVEDRRARPKGLEVGEVVFYGPGDALAQGEEAPELPETLPEGWPAEPEEAWDPEDPESTPPPARQRLSFKAADREVVLTCDKFVVRARTGLELTTLGELKVLWGEGGMQFGDYAAPTSIGGEEATTLATTGDCVEVGSGSSAGTWPIVEGCE